MIDRYKVIDKHVIYTISKICLYMRMCKEIHVLAHFKDIKYNFLAFTTKDNPRGNYSGQFSSLGRFYIAPKKR